MLLTVRISIALTLTSLIFFAAGLFLPFEYQPFGAGEEFIISAVVGLVGFCVALCVWLKATHRERVYRVALILSTFALVVTAGFVGLFVVAYSNCPNGAC